jgi:hypothetical protein
MATDEEHEFINGDQRIVYGFRSTQGHFLEIFDSRLLMPPPGSDLDSAAETWLRASHLKSGHVLDGRVLRMTTGKTIRS